MPSLIPINCGGGSFLSFYPWNLGVRSEHFQKRSSLKTYTMVSTWLVNITAYSFGPCKSFDNQPHPRFIGFWWEYPKNSYGGEHHKNHPRMTFNELPFYKIFGKEPTLLPFNSTPYNLGSKQYFLGVRCACTDKKT